MEYIIMIVCMMVLFLNVLKIIYAEIDGRRANKTYNIRYFLQFTRNFTYTRMTNILFMAFFIFMFTSDQKMFTMAWFLELALLVSVAMIGDIISQYAGYVYSKIRFKEGIQKALDAYNRMKSALTSEKEEDIVYPENTINFKGIVESHMHEEEHVGFASLDGGKFVASISNLPPITYVIDTRKELAEKNLEGRNVKITTLTKDRGLPFKDEKIDTYTCCYTNFNKVDVLRILKPQGTLLIHQIGSSHLNELQAALLPIKANNSWNKYACQSILEQNGFQVLDGQEQMGKIRFNSIEGLFTYLNKTMPDKIYYFENYVNQYAYIDACIKARGYFEMTMHEFYVECKKI